MTGTPARRAARARGRVPTLCTTLPSEETVSAPISTRSVAPTNRRPSVSVTVLARSPARRSSRANVRPSPPGRLSSTMTSRGRCVDRGARSAQRTESLRLRVRTRIRGGSHRRATLASRPGSRRERSREDRSQRVRLGTRSRSRVSEAIRDHSNAQRRKTPIAGWVFRNRPATERTFLRTFPGGSPLQDSTTPARAPKVSTASPWAPVTRSAAIERRATEGDGDPGRPGARGRVGRTLRERSAPF
jgi:hypothetical protein